MRLETRRARGAQRDCADSERTPVGRPIEPWRNTARRRVGSTCTVTTTVVDRTESADVPLFLDRHDVSGATVVDLREAHRLDLEAQEEHDVRFLAVLVRRRRMDSVLSR